MIKGTAARPGDPARDFCQWPYDRPYPPGPAALRQSLLLYEAVSRWPDGTRVLELLSRVKDHFGPFNTVWGLKSAGQDNRLDLELYFYDYDRAERRHTLLDAARALPDLLPVPVGDLDAVPFFMWSVELSGHAAPPARIDIYTDGFGGTASGGICHAWDGRDLVLKNLYHFFETAEDVARITAALATSARTARLMPGPDWLTPGAWGEQIFVFAQKSASDAVYLSRLTTQATQMLCQTVGFPGWLTTRMAAQADALNHHLWDVGLDYADDGAKARLVKAGLYGLL